MSDPIVSLRDLRLTRGGRPVLEVARLDVVRGEIWVLVGPNGAGKSTLLRMLALLDAPAAGTLALFGEPVPARPLMSLRRRTHLAFQETLLLDDSVVANVGLPLRLRGASAKAARREALAALELFGATPLAERRATSLSGGEARRVVLARGFAASPELLLLDEPFAALDPPSRESLAAELKAALRAKGTTCVVVSHDRAEAVAFADHVGVLLGGRLVQAGPAEEVFRRPVSHEAARFIGVENLIPVRVVERGATEWRLDADGTALSCAPGAFAQERALACIRAQDVLVAPEGGAPVSARNAIRFTVEAIEPGPTGLLVRMRGPFPLVAAVTRAAVEDLGIAEGRTVVALVKSSAIHLA